MQKAHSNINWENYPSTDTPINETNLNAMDNSIDTIDDRVIVLDTSKANQSDLLQSVKGITYNTTTGVFVFTWQNGTTLNVDLTFLRRLVKLSIRGRETVVNPSLTNISRQILKSCIGASANPMRV